MRKKIGSNNGMDISIDLDNMGLADVFESFTADQKEETYRLIGTILEHHIPESGLCDFVANQISTNETTCRIMKRMNEYKMAALLYLLKEATKHYGKP